MDEININQLITSYLRKMQKTPVLFKRYLYDQIDWNNWVIGIKGERGVGKTTLILQYIKEHFPDKSKALYVSLDNFWFVANSLLDLVEYFYTHGGTHLFLDEVHHYQNWQTIIKNICDDYPDLHIVYTSSSMLQIDHLQGDLSRRQVVYTLKGMSFREFLDFEGLAKVPAVSMESIIQNHTEIAMDITGRGFKVLSAFAQYFKYGYYPFYKREASGFGFRLQEVVNQILESDLPATEEVSYATIQKAKRMLMILAQRVPQLPKMSELYAELETNRELGLKMLYALQRAGLLNFVSVEQKNFRSMSKPDKILLGNPNLMNALLMSADIGARREAFFVNQVSEKHNIILPKSGDFLVDGKYLFEVGGKNKTFAQIRNIPDSFLAVDDTEVGLNNRIPLWIFGLMY